MTASWTPAERAAFEAKRRSRNLALGLVLGALVLLFFGITVVRMAPGLANGKPQIGASASGPPATEPAK
jgi:type IV secretory pathway TrbL component